MLLDGSRFAGMGRNSAQTQSGHSPGCARSRPAARRFAPLAIAARLPAMGRTQVVCGAVAVMLAAGVAGCSSEPASPTITVFAAASLQPAFTEIAEQFKTDNPGVAVAFNFAGSSDLATQLTQGA